MTEKEVIYTYEEMLSSKDLESYFIIISRFQ